MANQKLYIPGQLILGAGNPVWSGSPVGNMISVSDGSTIAGTYNIRAGAAIQGSGSYNISAGVASNVFAGSYNLHVGNNTASQGNYNYAHGQGVGALGSYGMAFGLNVMNQTNTTHSIAFGNAVVNDNFTYYNYSYGNTITVYPYCDYNLVVGQTHILGVSGFATTADYNAVFGGTNTVGSTGNAHYNVVGGQSQVVNGTHNAVFGQAHPVTGHHNIVGGGSGGGNNVSGFNNLVVGWGCTVTGQDSIVSGQMCGSSGSHNIVNGRNSSAGGADNCVVGYGCGATGTQNAVFGEANVGTNYSLQYGRQHLLSADFTMAGGHQAHSYNYGERSLASGWWGSNLHAQTSELVLKVQTTDNTPTELSNPAAYLIIANGTAYTFVVTITAKDTANTDHASYRLKWSTVRGAGVATVTVDGLVKEVIFESQAAWDVSVTADTTNGRPAIKVTGEVGKTIRWVARVEITETV